MLNFKINYIAATNKINPNMIANSIFVYELNMGIDQPHFPVGLQNGADIKLETHTHFCLKSLAKVKSLSDVILSDKQHNNKHLIKALTIKCNINMEVTQMLWAIRRHRK